MMAARPLSSSSCGTSHLIRDGAFWRSASLSPTTAAGRCPAPRFSASCASAAERQRGFAGGSSCYYEYSYARSGSGGRRTAAAAAGSTLYDVLGLAAGATAQEIKAAYRKLARACHPDAAGGDRGGASADEFMRVHAAYTTLSDPDKRAEYDRRLVAARGAGSTPPFPPAPLLFCLPLLCYFPCFLWLSSFLLLPVSAYVGDRPVMVGSAATHGVLPQPKEATPR